MTTMQTPRLFDNLWKSMLAWGVLTLVLGVVVLVWPGISVNVAAILFGAYLLVAGIAQIVAALGIPQSVGSRVLWFISGALCLVVGVLAFRHLDQGYPILLLAIWIGVGFIFQGVAEVTLAASVSELPDRGWHIFLGCVSVIAGFVVLSWPLGSILILAIVTGAWLVVIGITQIVWALRARSKTNAVEQKFEQVKTQFAGERRAAS